MLVAIIVVLLYIKRDTDKKTFYCNHRLAKVEVEVVASKSHTLVTLLYSDPVWSLLALVGSFSIFQVNIPCRPFSVYERFVLYSLIVSSILCDTDSVEAKWKSKMRDTWLKISGCQYSSETRNRTKSMP